jgi:hypothetical protein
MWNTQCSIHTHLLCLTCSWWWVRKAKKWNQNSQLLCSVISVHSFESVRQFHACSIAPADNMQYSHHGALGSVLGDFMWGFGGQRGTAAGFLLSLFVFPCHHNSTIRAAESRFGSRWKTFSGPHQLRTGWKYLHWIGKTDSKLQSGLGLVWKG